ncbi:hypothetical protein [Flavobacterium phragmitis]|uniref:Uncharacterized protein n=1 Tax=Flavobacterium phragmitis TaxID=739143 RepID=A0A1I1WGU4_9FLAO|nr:hypothetical protein [Flavobacterium phragmitis]SFD94386.1 hypothetical protein SAMN05216297_11560 [Flavobacterium phragmitis]
MGLRKTIFGRNKSSYYLYFKTKADSSVFNIQLTATYSGAVQVKLVGLTSNYVYYKGLKTNNQNFDLSYNTIDEEIGYFLSTKEFICFYINMPSKSLTMIDFSRFRCTWLSVNQLQNNNITTCIWGGAHLETASTGYDFTGNLNFTESMLPTDTVSTSKFITLIVPETKVTDVYFLLNNFKNLTNLTIGNSFDNFVFPSPITSLKLSSFTIKAVQNTIPNLIFENCPMLKFFDFLLIKIVNITIDNCPLFETFNAWNNKPIFDINRKGSSKIKSVNIGLNSFTPAIKDKIIDYCVNDGELNGWLQISKTPNPPTNMTGLAILKARGWTGNSL